MARFLQRLHSKSHLFSQDEISKILQPVDPVVKPFTGIKVVFTIGPSCHDVESLSQILNAGATIARVDVSWGDVSFHIRSLKNLQLAMKKTKHMCAVMLDTSGREIKVKRQVQPTEDGWWTHSKGYEVDVGQNITLTSRDVEASSSVLPLDYKELSEMAQPGDHIYISRYLQTGSDSSVYLTVKDVTPTDVVCEVQNKAVIEGLLTVWHIERNPYGPISNKQNDNPLLTKEDKEAIRELAAEFEIDFISLSHSREAEDIDEAREFMKKIGSPSTKIIAKVETKYALTRFKDILNQADGLMISRANLGLDVPAEKIALIQKNMISWCNLLGKPCIVTRVCDTMINSPRPTRAEATDCANIILDGADGFVLGAETLRGKFPVETVKTVLDIGRTAEQQFDPNRHYDYLMEEAILSQQQQALESDSISRSASETSELKPSTPSYADFSNAVQAIATVAVREESDEVATPSRAPLNTGIPYLSKVESIASSAVRAADKIAAKLLVVFTHSGHTSHLVAKYRPKIPILTLVVPRIKSNALTWKLEGREVARQCLLVRGLLPMLAAPKATAKETLKDAIIAAKIKGLIGEGDRVVVVQRIHEDFALKIMGVDELLDAPDASEKQKKMPHIGHLRTLSEVTDVTARR